MSHCAMALAALLCAWAPLGGEFPAAATLAVTCRSVKSVSMPSRLACETPPYALRMLTWKVLRSRLQRHPFLHQHPPHLLRRNRDIYVANTEVGERVHYRIRNRRRRPHGR